MTETNPMCDIRLMRRPELDLAVEWAAREGWNPGLSDAQAFWRADPEGFLIAQVAGEPVAVISAVRTGRSFAFIGFYIVRPDARGRGFGKALWDVALDRLRGRTVGLDGVVTQQDNYRRSGFVFGHRNIRFAGCAGQGSLPAPDDAVDIVPLSGDAPDGWLAYERPFFPEPRRRFLRAWVTRPGTTARAARRSGQLAGLAVVRPCRTGVKIGPLFADTPAVAGTLLADLVRRLPAGTSWFLDVPEANPQALALAAACGLQRVFETARMYRGPKPDLALDRTWSITSFELG